MELTIVTAIVAAAAGVGAGFLVRAQTATRREGKRRGASGEDLGRGKNRNSKTLLLEAKEVSLKMIEEAKAEEKQRHEETKRAQEGVEQRESTFDKQLLDLEEKP